MIKHIKKLVCLCFALMLCLGCLTGCRNIEAEVDAEFAKYTVDENLSLEEGYYKYIYFSDHQLCLEDLVPDKKYDYKDRGYVLYKQHVYFTRTIKRNNKTYPCVYKCDLYGNGIELVAELEDANYIASNGYEKILYLEFNSTKNNGNSVIKSYNVETGEYKYELTGMDVDPYVVVLKKTDRQLYMHNLGIEDIDADRKNNCFNIKKGDSTISIDNLKLQEYDFGRSLIKYNGKVLFKQVKDNGFYLGYSIMTYEVEEYKIVVLEYDVETELLLYKSYFDPISITDFIDRVVSIRQIN